MRIQYCAQHGAVQQADISVFHAGLTVALVAFEARRAGADEAVFGVGPATRAAVFAGVWVARIDGYPNEK